MKSAVTKGSYKDVDAFVLENDDLRVTVVPECGSKVASMIYKPLGIELLWQNPSPSFRRSAYADDYELGDFSAFDEMFPTISRCFYERFPWAGTEVPDHGEVWSIPWDVEREPSEGAGAAGAGSLNLSVRGIQFPYKLTKRVALEGGRLRIDYTASNLSGFEFDCLWAAHPLFNASEGMELIVPPGMNRVVNAVPGPTLGGYGRIYDFPFARLEDGREVDLSRVPSRNDAGYRKFWFLDRATEGWCMLHDPARSLTVGIAYPADKIPYLGVWLNEGGWEGQYNIAPEPATAAMDRIDFARMWGMNSALGGRQTLSWHLCISVASGDRPAGMGEDGEFVPA